MLLELGGGMIWMMWILPTFFNVSILISARNSGANICHLDSYEGFFHIWIVVQIYASVKCLLKVLFCFLLMYSSRFFNFKLQRPDVLLVLGWISDIVHIKQWEAQLLGETTEWLRILRLWGTIQSELEWMCLVHTFKMCFRLSLSVCICLFLSVHMCVLFSLSFHSLSPIFLLFKLELTIWKLFS
jgi:hypothetical protein